MKIIDFKRKGNVVRFYLGKDSLKDWYGDDWDDVPYEHNAEQVYSEFISDIIDIAFPFESLVLEPQDDWHNNGNSEYCKNDMVARKVPCIIVVPSNLVEDYSENFHHYALMDGVTKFYFGDNIENVKNMIKKGDLIWQH